MTKKPTQPTDPNKDLGEALKKSNEKKQSGAQPAEWREYDRAPVKPAEKEKKS